MFEKEGRLLAQVMWEKRRKGVEMLVMIYH